MSLKIQDYENSFSHLLSISILKASPSDHQTTLPHVHPQPLTKRVIPSLPYISLSMVSVTHGQLWPEILMENSRNNNWYVLNCTPFSAAWWKLHSPSLSHLRSESPPYALYPHYVCYLPLIQMIKGYQMFSIIHNFRHPLWALNCIPHR